MTIIVLGGSGFLGKLLLKKLNQEHLPHKSLIHEKAIDDDSCFFGDITDKNFLDNHISDGDIIVNLIGQENEHMFDQNIKGSYNLLNSIIKKKNIRIIFTSSILVYGDSDEQMSNEMDLPKPITEYGIIKLLSENIYDVYSRLFGLDVTILRFSNIYGPKKDSGIISKCIHSIQQQNPIILNQNGNQTRDFLHVDDAINAIFLVLQNHFSGFQIFNISSSVGIQINQIVDLIEKYTKKTISKKFVNEKQDIKYIVGDNSKAKNLLNFSVKNDIYNGLKDIINKLDWT